MAVDPKKRIAVALILIAVLSFSMPESSAAQSVKDLQEKIQERNEKIDQLEKEIELHQAQIKQTTQQANTLQSAIRVLDANGKKLSTELTLTQTSIGKTELAIAKLSSEIGDLEEDVESNTEAIADTIRKINEADNSSMLEVFLLNADITSVWEEIDTLENFQKSIQERIATLREIQNFLHGKIDESEKEKQELVSLKGELADRKQLVDQNKKQQSVLLAETKNKEAEYQRLLAQKEAQRAAFERELFEYEAQLNRIIDKSKIAPAGKGVLAWPLSSIRITQYFGRTVDAARLYSSGTHNGIDLAASRGTKVMAALSGVVKGVGNTDSQPGCYSYGKWVLVEHNNGLSTLYAHLDLISVSEGQSVATGQLLGYSGATGYATGPHLHFTVYATQGVEVARYSHSIHCQQVSIPIADQDAYLDPISYLP